LLSKEATKFLYVFTLGKKIKPHSFELGRGFLAEAFAAMFANRCQVWSRQKKALRCPTGKGPAEFKAHFNKT